MTMATDARQGGAGGYDRLRNVDVCLTVELGRTHMKLREVLTLGEGSVVPLERMTDEPLDVCVNGNPIAKAQIVSQDNRFALEIVSLIDDEQDAPNGIQAPQTPQPPTSADAREASA